VGSSGRVTSARSERGPITVRVARIGRFVRVDDAVGPPGPVPGQTIAAWDPELDRRVALRPIGIVDDTASDDPAQRAAQRLAQVHHPAVARVLEVFVADGHRYVALETVVAPPLSQWCGREPRPSATRCVEVALAAARGVETAPLARQAQEQGLTGQAIGQRIHAARVRALTQALWQAL
jgi:hypothetical protein